MGRNRFGRWFFKPARWWQFWLPMSGVLGGLFCSLIIMLIAALFSFAHGATLDRWAASDPELRQWFQSLKQPDRPMVSCCGSGDAYYADEVDVVDGKIIATVTDNRGNPVPEGTRVEVPVNKLNRDPNKTGHAILFMSPDQTVYCFIMGTGV